MIVKLKFWTVAVMCPLFQQSQCHPCVSTSDNDTSTHEEESSELVSSGNKTSDVWCKTVKKTKQQMLPSNHRFENSEIMSSITGDDLILLFTEHSYLYHSRNAQQGKVSPKTLV